MVVYDQDSTALSIIKILVYVHDIGRWHRHLVLLSSEFLDLVDSRPSPLGSSEADDKPFV